MATDPQARILELLKRFNNNETVCIEELQTDPLWEGKSERTIGRDLKVIKDYFPNAFELIRGVRGDKGCYKAVTKQTFDNFMNPETLSLMTLTFSMASKSDLFDSFNLNEDDKKLITKELKNVNKVYEFKNKPFEAADTDKNIMRKLEHSIKFGKCIVVEYPVNGKMVKTEVKPYKILFMNENFYLACEVEHDDYMFTPYRISKINSVSDTPKTFRANPEIVEFIKDIQTPFATYAPDYKRFLIDVVVEVDRSKAFFFQSKKHLKSQEIKETKENGNIIVNFRVTQTIEVESLIKSWLPHIKVIAPVSLKAKLESELKRYIEEIAKTL